MKLLYDIKNEKNDIANFFDLDFDLVLGHPTPLFPFPPPLLPFVCLLLLLVNKQAHKSSYDIT